MAFRTLVVLVLCSSAAALPVAATAQNPAFEGEAALSSIPAAARAGPGFDAEAATRAYLETVPEEDRARSDAYYEGGHWLMLWNFLLSSAILLVLLKAGWSARMRDGAERLGKRPIVHDLAYWAQFMAVTTVLAFPLTVYQGFVREHGYGMATQTFGAWMGDQLKGLALGVVFGGLFVALIYRVLRRAPRTWWAWGSVVAIGFFMLGSLIAPVFIAPLFNTYTRLDDPVVSEPILRLARANGIPVSEVYVMDASRQTTRISANVSGFLGTERITLNDNLLERASLPEIEAVMGHEMGHYVLNHVYKGLLFFGVLIVLVFAALHRSSTWALARWGDAWGVRGVGDIAGLPLLGLLVGALLFVATPVINNVIRAQEYEADIFGINAARQPDGMAQISLKLGEYRKLDPGPWEEVLFFDHPSGRTRIHASMRWKAEHPGEAP